MGYYQFYTRKYHPESLRIVSELLGKVVRQEDFSKGKSPTKVKDCDGVPIKILKDAIKIVRFLRDFSP